MKSINQLTALLIGLIFLQGSKVNAQQTELKNYILEGSAINYTAGQIKAGLNAEMNQTSDKIYECIFYWDNENLLGSADTKGWAESIENGVTKIKFYGRFDCGGIGSWPVGTTAPFSAELYWNENEGTLKGKYKIHKEGRMYVQEGRLSLSKEN